MYSLTFRLFTVLFVQRMYSLALAWTSRLIMLALLTWFLKMEIISWNGWPLKHCLIKLPQHTVMCKSWWYYGVGYVHRNGPLNQNEFRLSNSYRQHCGIFVIMTRLYNYRVLEESPNLFSVLVTLTIDKHARELSGYGKQRQQEAWIVFYSWPFPG